MIISSRLNILIFLFIITVMVLAPVTVLAQGGDIIPCDGPDCNAMAFVQLVQNVINWIIGVSAPIAAIAFGYAGFLMLTAAGNQSQIDKAKKIFTMVGIGFIFILGGWLLVYTITSNLLEDPNLPVQLGEQ